MIFDGRKTLSRRFPYDYDYNLRIAEAETAAIRRLYRKCWFSRNRRKRRSGWISIAFAGIVDTAPQKTQHAPLFYNIRVDTARFDWVSSFSSLYTYMIVNSGIYIFMWMWYEKIRCGEPTDWSDRSQIATKVQRTAPVEISAQKYAIAGVVRLHTKSLS